MQKKMDTPERGVKIIELDGAYQMCTKPEMYEALLRWQSSLKDRF